MVTMVAAKLNRQRLLEVYFDTIETTRMGNCPNANKPQPVYLTTTIHPQNIYVYERTIPHNC